MKIFRTLKSSKMKLYNVWSWPASVIDDIQQWMLVNKALKEPQVVQALKTFPYELRVDKIGRIYTVVNIPEELWEYEKRQMVWPWMLDQLRELDELLISIRLSDLLYPVVDPIGESDAMAYRIILSPSTESLSIWKFLRWILNLGFVTFTTYIINAMIIKFTGSSIINLFLSIF